MICLINYFRFIYKVYEKASSIELSGFESIKRTHGLLVARIAEVFRKHLASVKDRSNQFELDSLEWINFATSERWAMYEFVIGKYSSKYKNIIDSCEFSQTQSIKAQELFCYLWETYKEHQLKAVMLESQKKQYQ